MRKKVLLTTRVGLDPSHFEYAMPHKLLSLDFHFPAMGIRFLVANVPNIKFLEFPSWEEYENELREGIDVLGISFYTKDIPVVKKMIDVARNKYHVPTIFGGNYGVLTEEVAEWFDKIFIGYAEKTFYEELYSCHFSGNIEHPLLIAPIKAPLFPFLSANAGILFTHRGCKLRCSFCQTPVFCPCVSKIEKDNLIKVIDAYKKRGIKFIIFAEENFNPWQNIEIIEHIKELKLK